MAQSRINVTKTYLPPMAEYQAYLDQIWQTGQLTNQGPLLLQLESQLRDHLGVEHLQMVSNGTIALQIALQALGITEGEIITTPFTYVATASSILWQRCTPVFVDIEDKTFCIDADKVEAAITNQTKAIMAVHVFGFPCDVEKLDEISRQHNLPIIYDAAHTFGVTYKGKSLLSYGDISTCSFHATKPFHTIEGGCVIARDKAVNDKLELIKRFGHNGDEHFVLGINAKASEFQAAMGLANLPHIEEIIAQRKASSELYSAKLTDAVYRPSVAADVEHNYAYYPVVFKDAATMEKVRQALELQDIYPRRYFYPSLNTLPYVEVAAACPVSEDIAQRILCLPLYVGLAEADIERICQIINHCHDS